MVDKFMASSSLPLASEMCKDYLHIMGLAVWTKLNHIMSRFAILGFEKV